MSFLKSLGKIAGGALKVAAPFAGFIPGVGPLAAAGLAAGGTALGRLASGDNTFGKGGLKNIALAGGAGAAGSALTGGQGVHNLGSILPKLGAIAKQPGVLGNASGTGINFGKAIGAGGAIANTIGGMQQRSTNQKALQAQTDLRNQLISRILSGNQQTYNFQPTF